MLAWFRGGSKAKALLFTGSSPVVVQRLDGPRIGAAMGGSTGLNAKSTVAVVTRASRMSSKPPTSLLGPSRMSNAVVRVGWRTVSVGARVETGGGGNVFGASSPARQASVSHSPPRSVALPAAAWASMRSRWKFDTPARRDALGYGWEA